MSLTRRVTHALALGGVLSLAPFLPSALASPAAIVQGGACSFSRLPGAVWWGSGSETRMTLGQLVAYLAPIYWFSPDEPLLHGAEGADIRLPEPFAFEDAPDAPVVYYQVEQLLTQRGAPGPGYVADESNKHNSVVDLAHVRALQISFYAYFTFEEGLGAHEHDVEAAEFKVGIGRHDDPYVEDYADGDCAGTYVMVVTRVSAKAHGIIWFWNVIETDPETKFPMHLLVEEGKHGLATDKNGDGYFTPGYDVNRHINDAWGVRDVIRGGQLFTGGYQGWMAKVRQPEHRAYPPLPEDSPVRGWFERKASPEAERAVYELRPFPPTELAKQVEGLYGFVHDKEVPNWPETGEVSGFTDLVTWVQTGTAVKSLAIALRADGDLGFSFVFPFFIVKNFEDKVSGGFIVWRLYLKDEGLRDFGLMVMYTPSASRWIDTYLAAGWEWDDEIVNGVKQTDDDFVLETGVKFRVQLGHSPFKFLTVLTDFWGFRAGVKNKGFFDIDRLTYVLEIGAGAW